MVLRLLGLWTLRDWWTTVDPYSPLGQWKTAFVVAAWSWYGVYTTTGAWCLRAHQHPWIRSVWRRVFVGCAAFSLIVFVLGAIIPGVT